MTPTNDPRKGKPSASGLHRIIKCPGSWLYGKKFENRTTPDAERGKKIHKALETGNQDELTDEEKEIADDCAKVLDKTVYSLIPEDCTYNVWKELRWWDSRESFSGQADIVFRWEKDGETNFIVADYKTGNIAVPDVEENAQLQALAALCWSNLAPIDNLGKIYVFNVQPLVTHSPRILALSQQDCLDALKEIRVAVQMAEQEGAPLNASDQHACKYCPAKLACPALFERMTKEIATKRTTYNEMTPEEKLARYKTCKQLEAAAKLYADEVKNEIIKSHKEGKETPIPGLLYSETERTEVKEPIKALREVSTYIERETGIAATELIEDYVSSTKRQLLNYAKTLLKKSTPVCDKETLEQHLYNVEQHLIEKGYVIQKEPSVSIKVDNLPNKG